jgi:hypothetical protein
MAAYNYNRQLPERSKVVFMFPSHREGESAIQVVLPFFENIDIKEQKVARYSEFKLLSRSSNIYGYTGSDSRKFSLTFKMTLPHLQFEHPELTLNDYIFKNAVQSKNLNWWDMVTKPPGTKNVLVNQTTKLSKKFMDAAELETNSLAAFHISDAYKKSSFKWDQISNYPYSENPELEKTVELMLYWTNIVRASVSNNTNNPVLGPPIVRFTHGILYQDIPCICKSYNLTFKNESGYEIKTLMPRVLEFQLDLEENRTGNFGKFEKYKQVTRDNLAGYEAILSDELSMDPGSLEDA